MHYICLLVTKEFPTEEIISSALVPYNEESFYADYDEENPENHTKTRPAFLWDWYQIGGRYNGLLKLKCNEQTEEAYRWNIYEREPRNGRLFWSYLLTNAFKTRNMFSEREEDFFPSMGQREGFLYVDSAFVDDLLNFDDVPAYYCIDKDGNAFASDSWGGNSWIKNASFEDELKRVKSESAGCYATIIDMHD